MSNLKVEGKVADFCPKCKNCKSTTKECDGEKDWLTEVECEDPYDGMIKTLDADSDICCSMFTPKPDRACGSEGSRIEKNLREANEYLLEKCKGYIAENAELKLKIENTKGFDTLISNLSKQIQDLKIDNARLDRLYSERDRELKGLIKASKRKDDLIQSYRKKLKKADDEKLIVNIQKVIFPQEEGSDYTYSYDEILSKVKDLKVQSDENGTMYEDLKYWKERCHNAESDVTTLTSEVGTLNNMYNRLKDKSDKEIENLKEKNEELKMMVERRDKWVEELKSDVDTLQNECLVIAEIAKRAYDETNRD